MLCEGDCEDDTLLSLSIFLTSITKLVTLRFLVFTSGVPKCPGDEARVLSMSSAREMRPKDRVRGGVMKTSRSSVRMDSRISVCRFC